MLVYEKDVSSWKITGPSTQVFPMQKLQYYKIMHHYVTVIAGVLDGIFFANLKDVPKDVSRASRDTSTLQFQRCCFKVLPYYNVHSVLYAQRRFRSLCGFVLSNQNLYWTQFGQPRMQSFFMRTTKTLIKQRGCAGWFEFSLVHMPAGTFSQIAAHICSWWPYWMPFSDSFRTRKVLSQWCFICKTNSMGLTVSVNWITVLLYNAQRGEQILMSYASSEGPNKRVNTCSLIWTFFVRRHIIKDPMIL